VDHGGGGGEADGEALLTGGQPQAQGNMGFARAARPEGDDVFPPLDPFTAGQFEHLHLVEAGDRLEVEAIETFDRGELGGLDPALDHPPFAVDQLQFHQSGKKLNVVQPLGGALLGHLVVFPQDGRQLQRLEVVSQKKFGGVGHAAFPDTRHM
jgi:hypothetical protein